MMSRIYIFSALFILIASAPVLAAKPVVTSLPLAGEKVNGEEIRSFDNYFQDALFQTGAVRMIERKRLNKVLADQALKDSGITEEQAQKVAKALAVEVYISGDMRKIDDKFQITVRGVTADDAKVVATASASAVAPSDFKEAAGDLARQLTTQLAGKVERSEENINRKVLVLDFVNQNKTENAEYLSGSIAEAMIDPLDKTGNFQTLNRDNGQQTAATLKIEKEKFFNEANATEIGKAGGAEVVVIGNFIAIGDKIQIQAKAVDVLTGRVKVSKSVNGKLDASIFDTITQLSGGMAQKMKSALPPISKREVITLTGDGPSYGGMLWRTAVLPGWGHIYADKKRGYIYLALWAGSLGTFVWSHLNYTSSQSAYTSAKTDFDSKYNAYSQAMDLRAYLSYGVLGVTALVWADALLFGRGIGSPGVMSRLPGSGEAPGVGIQIQNHLRTDFGSRETYTSLSYGYSF